MADPETGFAPKDITEKHHVFESPVDISIGDSSGIKPSWSKRLYVTLQKLDTYGVEGRGIERVKPDERRPVSLGTWAALCLVWSSAGLGLSTFATGLLGPLYYNLTLGQSVAIIWTVGALGSAVSGYASIFGKKHGLRALANSRYTFGYYGAMALAILNVLTNGIFGVQMGILGGQALHALSRGKLPVAGAIPLILIVSWLVATGGYKFIHYYQRVAVLFPFIVFMAMYGVVGSQFTSTSSITEPVSSSTQAGLTLSFIAIIFGSSSGWVPVTADYYIYFPEDTPNWQPYLLTFFGIWLLPCLSYTCGAGYATVLLSNADWLEYYNAHSENSPYLILYSLERLGNVRYFFIFCMALSTLNNNILNLYSISISMQILGKWTTYIPRLVWNLIGAVVIFVIAIAGRDSIYSILSNTVALIAYWTILMFVIIWIEHTVFRRKRGYDLEGWDDPKRLSPGYAAGLAFCIGAAGCIVGMGQTWYYGPIARHIGAYGGDIGIELGFMFSGISYPILRRFGIKHYGR